MSDQDNSMDQSFNDAELQDIMNEIENLEKEFVEDEGAETEAQASEEETPQAESQPEEEVTAAEVQEEESVSAEAEEEAEQGFVDASETPEAQTEEHEEETSNVVSLSSAKPVATTGEEGHMSFSGSGQMNMELTFDLGEEKATVSVSDGKLQVTMNGVNLSLSEEGCEVNMTGGVKFHVPVSGQGTAKKAA